jgi:hypothetical protein
MPLESPLPWINRYGTFAVVLMLLLLMNPELRAFLLLANFIGLDLMIFFFWRRPAYRDSQIAPALVGFPRGTVYCFALVFTAQRLGTRYVSAGWTRN